MTLLDRYLNAVHLALIGHSRREDIVAELREEILSRIEENEAELGRSLSDAEVEALLKQHGHPLVAASRYRGRQYLVGPTMLPLYEAAVMILLGLAALVQVILVIASPDPVEAASDAAGSFVNAALTSIGLLTVIAVALERAQVRFDFLERWSVRDLPDLRGSWRAGSSAAAAGWKDWISGSRQSRWDHLVQLIAASIFLLWWTGVIAWSPEWALQGTVLRLGWAPVWEGLYWPVVALAVLTILTAAIGFLAARPTPVRSLLEAVTSIAGLAIVGWALQHQPLVEVSVRGPTRDAASLVEHVNRGVWLVLVGCAIAWLVELGRAAWNFRQAQAGRSET
jgi:hypothetical protein